MTNDALNQVWKLISIWCIILSVFYVAGYAYQWGAYNGLCQQQRYIPLSLKRRIVKAGNVYHVPFESKNDRKPEPAQ